MTRVAVAVAASQAASPAHPHVVLMGAGHSVVLDITNPEAEFDGIGSQWEQINRPGKKPWNLRSGDSLGTVSLEFVIGNDDTTDVGPRLAALTAIAKYADRVIVGHTTPTGAPMSTNWTLTDARWRVRLRRHGDNAITSVRGTLTLTESSSPLDATWTLPTTLSWPVTTNRPVDRRHTITASDSIWSIAQRHYPNDPEAWRRIADANALPNLTRLPVGAVLILP